MTAIDKLKDEWNMLKKSGLLCQIGCTAGPKILKRENRKPVYDMFKWNATIQGPKKTPYEGYLFNFEITYPDDYPNKPPTVTCKTKIYHMNISTSGDVCVSSIHKDKEDNELIWKDAGNISEVLLSIFCILGKPNIKSPYRKDLAQLYINKKEEYEKNARECCQINAMKII